jgi:septum formation protein
MVQKQGMMWHTVTSARLTVRNFSDAFLDAYLGADGSAILGSVGSYRLEGRGIQLFARIEGDYFAILGLPLLELLGFLRDRRALSS